MRSLFVQAIEVLAVIGLPRPFVGRFDAGAEELARRERQLIPVLGLAGQERPLPIEPRAVAEGARQLAVDEHRKPHIGARGRQLIGRDQRVDRRLDERRLGGVQGVPDLGLGRCCGRRRLRGCTRSDPWPSRRPRRRRQRRRLSRNCAARVSLRPWTLSRTLAKIEAPITATGSAGNRGFSASCLPEALLLSSRGQKSGPPAVPWG